MIMEMNMSKEMQEIEAFLLSEREKVLSETEWRFRMRGYGFNLRRTEGGVEVAKLPQNHVLGTLEM
ncbi:MAG: hypothetical protein JXQ89_14105 [Pelagimonas sp.]|jgi:hypothetical protein